MGVKYRSQRAGFVFIEVYIANIMTLATLLGVSLEDLFLSSHMKQVPLKEEWQLVVLYFSLRREYFVADTLDLERSFAHGLHLNYLQEKVDVTVCVTLPISNLY